MNGYVFKSLSKHREQAIGEDIRRRSSPCEITRKAVAFVCECFVIQVTIWEMTRQLRNGPQCGSAGFLMGFVGECLSHVIPLRR